MNPLTAILIKVLKERGARNILMPQIGRHAFFLALNMCGNEGQYSIISSTGQEVYVEAAVGAYNGDIDPYTYIYGNTSHPEAVYIIIEKAAAIISTGAEKVREWVNLLPI